MTLDQIVALIGQRVDSEAVRKLVESAPLVASFEPDLEEGVFPRHSLSSHQEGYELTHAQGRICTGAPCSWTRRTSTDLSEETYYRA